MCANGIQRCAYNVVHTARIDQQFIKSEMDGR